MSSVHSHPAHDNRPSHPSVRFSFGQSSCKGEDVVVVLPKNAWPTLRANEAGRYTLNAGGEVYGPHDEFALFCVFDGHNGVLAAKYISETLLSRLVDKLPPGRPPSEHDAELFRSWREGIVRAMTEVLSETHLSFAKLGQLAGCTVTIVLQCGWLVTCANLGDSRCVIDNGVDVICMTDDHRVATNQAERRRVEYTGALIAPVCASGVGPAKDVNNGVGPLRIWPGGVCLSRGIGDFDLGDVIVPWPNVVQARVPATGARLMLCSDGVWDAFDHSSRIYKLSRQWQVEHVPQRMISAIVRAYGGLRDDTSIVVVDIMPPGREFADNLKKGKMAKSISAAKLKFKLPFGKSKKKVDAGNDQHGDDASAEHGEVVVHPIEILAKQDVAEVLGQFPSKEPTPANWAKPQLKHKLLSNHHMAFETWKKAAMEGALEITPRNSVEYGGALPLDPGSIRAEDMTVRAGRVNVKDPPTVMPDGLRSVFDQQSDRMGEDFSTRAGAAAYPAPDLSIVTTLPRNVRFAVDVDAHDALDEDELDKEAQQRRRENASVRFGRNIASDQEEYARKFGAYADAQGDMDRRARTDSGSLGSSSTAYPDYSLNARHSNKELPMV